MKQSCVQGIKVEISAIVCTTSNQGLVLSVPVRRRLWELAYTGSQPSEVAKLRGACEVLELLSQVKSESASAELLVDVTPAFVCEADETATTDAAKQPAGDKSKRRHYGEPIRLPDLVAQFFTSCILFFLPGAWQALGRAVRRPVLLWGWWK